MPGFDERRFGLRIHFLSSFFTGPRHHPVGIRAALDAIPGLEFDVSAFHDGRRDVVHAIYETYGAALLRETRRQTSAAEAEAVIHEVFVELLRNRARAASHLGAAKARSKRASSATTAMTSNWPQGTRVFEPGDRSAKTSVS